MARNKHYDLILAWADGAKIQFRESGGTDWYDVTTPSWGQHTNYRIKPEPKEDVIRRGRAWIPPMTKGSPPLFLESMFFSSRENVEFVFDGETRELKSVRII